MFASIAAAAMDHGHGCVYVTLCFVSRLIKLRENLLCIATINPTAEVCRIVTEVSEISVHQLLLGEGCDFTKLICFLRITLILPPESFWISPSSACM